MDSIEIRTLKYICLIGIILAACILLASCSSKPKKDTTVVSSVKYPKLLELGSVTCMQCKMMAPIIDNLRKTYKDTLNVEFIDVYKDKTAIYKYGVKTIPMQIFYDSKGKEFYRHIGIFSKEDILNQFKKQGIDIKK